MEPALILLDTNILIDVLRGEAEALRWLEQQGLANISVITWIEVLVGCRPGEGERVEAWLESFRRWLVESVACKTPSCRARLPAPAPAGWSEILLSSLLVVSASPPSAITPRDSPDHSVTYRPSHKGR